MSFGENTHPLMVAGMDAVLRTAAADSATRIRVAWLCATVLLLEGYDIVAIGCAVPALGDAWRRPPGAFTAALAAGNVGILLGSLTAGMLGDRRGRKPVLIACVIIFGTASLATVLAASPLQLAALRLFDGHRARWRHSDGDCACCGFRSVVCPWTARDRDFLLGRSRRSLWYRTRTDCQPRACHADAARDRTARPAELAAHRVAARRRARRQQPRWYQCPVRTDLPPCLARERCRLVLGRGFGGSQIFTVAAMSACGAAVLMGILAYRRGARGIVAGLSP